MEEKKVGELAVEAGTSAVKLVKTGTITVLKVISNLCNMGTIAMNNFNKAAEKDLSKPEQKELTSK